MIIWNNLKLFLHIHSYLFIFANTKIYEINYDPYISHGFYSLVLIQANYDFRLNLSV